MNKNQRNINKKLQKIQISLWLSNQKQQRKLQRKSEKGQNSKASQYRNADRKLKKVMMKLRFNKKISIQFQMKANI